MSALATSYRELSHERLVDEALALRDELKQWRDARAAIHRVDMRAAAFARLGEIRDTMNAREVVRIQNFIDLAWPAP